VSAAVVYLNAAPRRSLNIRQLLTPLFFPWGSTRHPDMKRQSSRRQRDRDLRAARALKTAYVPLRMVDPTVYLQDYRWDGIEHWHVVTLQQAYGSSYRRRVRETCEMLPDEEAASPTGRWRAINEPACWYMGRTGWRRMEPR
jgi:hypothetical protein